MLQAFRNALKGWFGKVIIAFFTIPFLFIGGSTIFTALSSSPDIEVNGSEISFAQVDRLVESNKARMRQQFGESFDPKFFPEESMRKNAVDQLILRELSEQYSDNNNIHASFSKVSETIRSIPNFSDETGSFSQEIFETVLAQQGIAFEQIVASIRSDLMVDQVRSSLIESEFILDNEVRRVENLKAEKRDFAYLTLTVKDFEKEILIEEESIADYYEANKNSFLTTEKVSIDYLELKVDEFKGDVTVSDAELKANYESFAEGLQENERRQAAHILFNIDEDQSESEAQKLALEVQEKIQQGEEFAELAKEFSQDSGSAKNGGDLGIAGKGTYDPEFEDALYGLNEGEVSSPVVSEFGVHLVKLIKIEEAEVPSFDSEKERILSELKESKAYDAYQEKLDGLEGLIYETPDLQESATLLGKKVQTTALFTKKQGLGIASNVQVRENAFSDNVLKGNENSALIEISDGHMAVIRLNTHEPAMPKALALVSDTIEKQLKNEKARAAVETKAQEVVSLLNEGKSTEDAGIEWKQQTKAGRNQAGVPRKLIGEVFRLAHPAQGDVTISKASERNGDISIVSLSAVYKEEVNLDAEKLAKNKERLERTLKGSSYQALLAHLKDKAEISEKEPESEESTGI